MSTNDRQDSIVRELREAIDELHSALQRATGATATIKGLLPRVGAVTSVFDEIEAVIQTGRRHLGADAEAQASFPRPTLVVTSTAAVRESPQHSPEPEVAPSAHSKSGASGTPAPAADGLISFRLEFESCAGSLDLRAVDDAVNEHPAVRDVALLDYDGRKATLKVWIIPAASPADVREALTVRSASLFPGGNEVSIVALEDVA